MCEVDCVQCINNTCVCPPGYGGYGEGVNLNGCHLNEHTIRALWYFAFGASMLPMTVALFLLARWLRGGGIDWAKMVTNRNFVILCTTTTLNTCLLISAAVRLFVSSYAFNDVLGTVFFCLVFTLIYVQADPLLSLYFDTLVSLLTALGAKDGIPQKREWVRPIALALFSLPCIPVLASPALSWEGRKAMVQYSLVVLCTISVLVSVALIILGEKASRVLASVGTEATVKPRRRIRLFLADICFTGLVAAVGGGILIGSQKYYPYFLPSFLGVIALASTGPPLAVSFDKSKIRREPSTHGAPRSTKEKYNTVASTSDETTDSNPKPSPPVVELVSVETTGPVSKGADSEKNEPTKEPEKEPEKKDPEALEKQGLELSV